MEEGVREERCEMGRNGAVTVSERKNPMIGYAWDTQSHREQNLLCRHFPTFSNFYCQNCKETEQKLIHQPHQPQ